MSKRLQNELIDDGFEPVTRHLVMERDLNYFGNLFGGTMLAWVDEASAIYVMQSIGYTNFVTVALDDVEFKAPARSGASVVFYCKTENTGRSSIEVRTRAFVHTPETDAIEEIIDCRVSFVCLKDGKPYRYFESAEYKNRMQ